MHIRPPSTIVGAVGDGASCIISGKKADFYARIPALRGIRANRQNSDWIQRRKSATKGTKKIKKTGS
jgi:hypothetical protein